MTTQAFDPDHQSVLMEEILQCFAEMSLHVFVDGTLGAAGHSTAILDHHPECSHLIGFDQDPLARDIAIKRLESHLDRVKIVPDNFRHLEQHLNALGIDRVDGILLDLGVSSMQLDRPEKGFSFSFEGPLDMRMDPSQDLTAEKIVNHWTEQELERLFRDYGEIPRWRAVAQRIVHERKHRPIRTTKELAYLLKGISTIPHGRKMHPMTLVFQALRIAVNDELEVIAEILPQAVRRLRSGGRLAVITFHSLEDRLVKQYFREAASDKIEDLTSPTGPKKKEPLVCIVTKKPVVPSVAETRRNPRSRSAKLRIVEKL
jgi:16S rRNA (cytosine1402-N4)-methyltransferase